MAATSRDKVRSYRARQRAKGLRLVQMWIPDVNSPEFIAEARRQSLAVAKGDQEADIRERQRAKGLRLVQMWIPDVNSPEFIAEARRQSLAAAAADRETDDQDFLDSVSILNDPDFDE